MTERKLTVKGFLHKTTTKAARSAEGFIAQYREFLQTGDLAAITAPILIKLDKGEILPTPALQEIKTVVFTFALDEDIKKAESAMVAAEESGERTTTPKNYMVDIVDSTGKVIDSFGDNHDLHARNWADRKLFQGASDCHAVITSTHLVGKNGQPLTQIVTRDSAIGRILKTSKGPVMKRSPQSSSSLGFGVKAKQDHAHFSKG